MPLLLKVHKFELYNSDWVMMHDWTADLEQYKNTTLCIFGNKASNSAIIHATGWINNKLNTHTKKANLLLGITTGIGNLCGLWVLVLNSAGQGYREPLRV